jgi:4-hydroxybenzoate polyprenyltransferase
MTDTLAEPRTARRQRVGGLHEPASASIVRSASASASIALAAGLAALSLLGPPGLEIIDYHVTPTLRSQTVGLGAATLAIVVPVTATAGVVALRGHPAAPAPAPCAFAVYMLIQYVVGPDYLRLPGDNRAPCRAAAKRPDSGGL